MKVCHFDYNFLPVNEEQKVCSVHIFWRNFYLMFNTTLEGNKFGFAIFGAGLKYKFNYNWALFENLCSDATNSDTLDYSDEYNLGNLNSKDWMNSMSLGLLIHSEDHHVIVNK